MGAWWDEEHKLWLVTPEEFARLPDGFELTAIDGDTAIKGKDEIDLDTRFGHIAWGASKEAILAALEGKKMSDDFEGLCHEELVHTDGPVTRKLKEQAQRIEQLEAALRKYASGFCEFADSAPCGMLEEDQCRGCAAHKALEGKKDER